MTNPENPDSTKPNQEPTQPPGPNPVFKDFLRVLLFPLLINKMFMFYFGLKYSENPGEGYGYGLAATVLFLAFTCGRFLWKYRHVEDP